MKLNYNKTRNDLMEKEIALISHAREVMLKILQASVQFSCSVMSNSLRPRKSQHARPPCPSPTPGVHSDSRPLSQ